MAGIVDTVRRHFFKNYDYVWEYAVLLVSTFFVEIRANKPCQFDCKMYNNFFAKNTQNSAKNHTLENRLKLNRIVFICLMGVWLDYVHFEWKDESLESIAIVL